MQKYEKFASSGLPFPLIFFVLPIILHGPTRSKIPSITRSPFHYWLTKNQPILINLPRRIRDLISITSEALKFLAYNDAIEIKSGLITLKKFEAKSNESTSLEVQDCFKKAETLGKWLATAGTPTTIFSMLGVKP